jgi:hypothetical protein
MGQSNERSGYGSLQEERRKNKGKSVLERFEQAPHRGSNEASHRIREMGQPVRSTDGSKLRKQ